MPAQVLVMCAACGRPQFPTQPDCVACGAKLPEAPQPAPRTARDALLECYEPILEADFGRGRVLMVSEKQLEWRVQGGRVLLAELAQIEWVRLRTRPVWEVLIPVAVLGVGAILVPWGWARGLTAVFAALWLVAGAVQRRCALAVHMRDGREATLTIGTGNPLAARARAIWSTVGPELGRLGVGVQG